MRVHDDDAEGFATFLDYKCIAYYRQLSLSEKSEFSFGIQTMADFIQRVLDAHPGRVPKANRNYSIRFGHTVPRMAD